MHSVILTPTFERQAERLDLIEDDLMAIVSAIADDPLVGDLIVGSGGVRKLRHSSRGKGKSGGLRTIHYFAGEDVPVFLLGVYAKAEKANLSRREVHQVAAILHEMVEDYREGKKA
jgi:hypothetical protein